MKTVLIFNVKKSTKSIQGWNAAAEKENSSDKTRSEWRAAETTNTFCFIPGGKIQQSHEAVCFSLTVVLNQKSLVLHLHTFCFDLISLLKKRFERGKFLKIILRTRNLAKNLQLQSTFTGEFDGSWLWGEVVNLYWSMRKMSCCHQLRRRPCVLD